MSDGAIPSRVPNWIDGREAAPLGGEWFEKLRPTDGRVLTTVARSRAEDIGDAVACARRAQPAWARLTPIARGEILREISAALKTHKRELTEIVTAETGKSPKLAAGETDGA